MIKITSELRTNQGFKSNISVLEINSYTITETIQLTVNSQPTTPMPAIGGKNVNINVSVYKSLTDKTAGASAYQPVDFPYNFSVQPAPEDEVNESYLYNQVKAKLNDLGYNTEFV